MIKKYAYDIEIFPNTFSVTFVDISSYFETFVDCVNDKGKPIPLTQKLSVKEIIGRLSKVDTKVFYITDTNDEQLIQMIAFINNMQPHYDDNNRPVRTDVFGYNSSSYDKLMIAALLMFYKHSNNTKELINKLYDTSKKIISTQNDYEFNKHDYFLNSLKSYSLPYTDIDVMTIFALNKVGKGVDKDGNNVYFGKSLKQTSINLQWYELLEYKLPPISDKDAHYYTSKNLYKGMSNKQLNSLISEWDRCLLDEWIPDMLHYNLNDVFIVAEIVRLYTDEIKLRYNIAKSYKVNVLSSSRSDIANKLFIKYYSEFSGLHESQWRGKSTERTNMSFKKVILPNIEFKTEVLKELLSELKQVTVHSIGKKALKEVANKYPNFKYLKTNKDSGWFEFKLNNLIYTVATGGLHSQDIPRELRSKIISTSPSTGGVQWADMDDNSYVFVHADVSDEA